MEEPYQYGEVMLLLSPLFTFIIAVTFRLMDNSASLFLQKEIIIDSSYVSLKSLYDQVEKTNDLQFRKRLTTMLLYRRLHRIFLLLTIPATLVSILTYTFLF